MAKRRHAPDADAALHSQAGRVPQALLCLRAGWTRRAVQGRQFPSDDRQYVEVAESRVQQVIEAAWVLSVGLPLEKSLPFARRGFVLIPVPLARGRAVSYST